MIDPSHHMHGRDRKQVPTSAMAVDEQGYPAQRPLAFSVGLLAVYASFKKVYTTVKANQVGKTAATGTCIVCMGMRLTGGGEWLLGVGQQPLFVDFPGGSSTVGSCAQGKRQVERDKSVAWSCGSSSVILGLFLLLHSVALFVKPSTLVFYTSELIITMLRTVAIPGFVI
jgi:hypothetical protein